MLAVAIARVGANQGPRQQRALEGTSRSSSACHCFGEDPAGPDGRVGRLKWLVESWAAREKRAGTAGRRAAPLLDTMRSTRKYYNIIRVTVQRPSVERLLALKKSATKKSQASDTILGRRSLASNIDTSPQSVS